MVTGAPQHETFIRCETEMDYARISDVHLKAFSHPDEAALVKRLRQKGLFTPEMSLVAELEGRVVGHVLFSEILVRRDRDSQPLELRALALAPVAVHPRFQKKGIGAQLIRAGIKEMERLGYEIILVLGEPMYYKRFGFRLEPGALIRSTYSGANFMALELKPHILGNEPGWTAIYSPPFEGL